MAGQRLRSEEMRAVAERRNKECVCKVETLNGVVSVVK